MSKNNDIHDTHEALPIISSAFGSGQITYEDWKIIDPGYKFLTHLYNRIRAYHKEPVENNGKINHFSYPRIG